MPPAERTPPPGAVFELAEKAVDFVRRAVGVPLDYTPETLPALDHYLRTVPRDQPQLVELVATTAGAYFGEVARRTLGGEWETTGPESAWRVSLTGHVTFSPVGYAATAISGEEAADFDGSFDVPLGDREAVEDALTARGEVPEDEYYSLSGRLEVLTLLVELLAARRAPSDRPPRADDDGDGDADDDRSTKN